jgi:CRP-like cAMP-binding protein
MAAVRDHHLHTNPKSADVATLLRGAGLRPTRQRVALASLRETDLVIAAGSFLPLKGRVATTLLELAENFGQDVGAGRIVIRQKIGQSDLAAMAGIARENVSRILNDWKRRKLVSRLSGYYCLENKAQLQTEAEL